MSKEFITVFTASNARHLLKQGYTIADIKPDKTDSDKKRSVFVFKNEKSILECLKRISKESEETKTEIIQ